MIKITIAREGAVLYNTIQPATETYFLFETHVPVEPTDQATSLTVERKAESVVPSYLMPHSETIRAECRLVVYNTRAGRCFEIQPGDEIRLFRLPRSVEAFREAVFLHSVYELEAKTRLEAFGLDGTSLPKRTDEGLRFTKPTKVLVEDAPSWLERLRRWLGRI